MAESISQPSTIRQSTDQPQRHREARQFRIWPADNDLCVELRSDREIADTYTIFEKHRRFFRRRGGFRRTNELWRRVMERRTGRHRRDELITTNLVRVMHAPGVWHDDP